MDYFGKPRLGRGKWEQTGWSWTLCSRGLKFLAASHCLGGANKSGGVALSSGRTPTNSDNRKTSLSVNWLLPTLPTCLQINFFSPSVHECGSLAVPVEGSMSASGIGISVHLSLTSWFEGVRKVAVVYRLSVPPLPTSSPRD